MRYSEFDLLEAICPGIKERHDVIDITRRELGEDLGYNIESFVLKEGKIYLTKDETDERYEISPITISGNDVPNGFKVEREKKIIDGENFTLTKSITFFSDMVFISTLEQFISKNYTILCANTKSVIMDEIGSYLNRHENMGFWAYDNRVIQSKEYQQQFKVFDEYSNYDFYHRYNKIEKKLVHNSYILPDYSIKIATNLSSDKEMIGKKVNNYSQVFSYKNDDIYYGGQYCYEADKERAIYNELQPYVNDMKKKLGISTTFMIGNKKLKSNLTDSNSLCKKKTLS